MAFNIKEGQETVEQKYDIKSKEGNWMKFEEGENKVRFVSNDVDFGNHWDTQLKKSFICTGKETCEYCKKGDKSKVRFYSWVIDRKDNKIKLAEYGYMIHKQMESLAKSEDYGFEVTPSYDVTITREGKNKDTKYTTLADRKDSKLTEEEEKMIQDTCKPLDEMIKAKKDKLLNETSTEIQVADVLKEEPVKETEEKIVLAKVD